MLDILRPFVPFVLVVGTLVALAGLVLTVRELRARYRVLRTDIRPRDWARENHDGR